MTNNKKYPGYFIWKWHLIVRWNTTYLWNWIPIFSAIWWEWNLRNWFWRLKPFGGFEEFNILKEINSKIVHNVASKRNVFSLHCWLDPVFLDKNLSTNIFVLFLKWIRLKICPCFPGVFLFGYFLTFAKITSLLEMLELVFHSLWNCYHSNCFFVLF